MFYKILTIVIILLVSNILALGQFTPRGTYPSSVYRGSSSEQEARKIIYDAKRDRARAGTLPNSGFRGVFSTSRRVSPKKAIKSLKPKAFEKEYKQFLKQENTGVIRLLSENKCKSTSDKDFNNPKNLMKKCPGLFINGGASYYSFRDEKYTSSMKSDIGVSGDWLFSFGDLNQGFLVELGDLDLTKVTSQDIGLEFLFEYIPATNLELADEQKAKLESGFKNNEYLYRSIVKLKPNITYGLRVIAYDNELPHIMNTHSGVKQINLLDGDPRKDIIVAFRVLEKTEDGSVVMLWKKLREADAPKLAVPETK